MLSTDVRLKVEFLCSRIARGQRVELSEMTWLQKWATSNRSVYSMLRQARRRAINGEPQRGSMDELLDGMDLGEPDPEDHLTNGCDLDTLAGWFSAPPWLRRD